jgi:hypothetical protein
MMDGMETGTQESAGGMPAGPEPYNPAGQMMPTDGGPGSSATPAPGAVASPGPDDYVMQPNVSHATDAQIGQFGPSAPQSPSDFAPMPTPDN